MKTLNLISTRWMLIMASTLIGFAAFFTACEQQEVIDDINTEILTAEIAANLEPIIIVDSDDAASDIDLRGYTLVKDEPMELKGWQKIAQGQAGKDIKVVIKPNKAINLYSVGTAPGWRSQTTPVAANQTKTVEKLKSQLQGAETRWDFYTWANNSTWTNVKVYVKTPGGTNPPSGNINLVTPGSTAETVALWNYLQSVPGQNKILAGIWDHGREDTGENGYTDVHNHTGKHAAIFSDDMWCWHPDGSTECDKVQKRVVRNSINHAKNGGIVSITWHWGNPFQQQFNGENAWITTSGSLANWQWDQMFTSGTWANDVINRDIDRHVNDVLKKIKYDDGTPIPILFRPLHEIDGTWFWWSNHDDPSKTVALWNYIYNRVVHHHGMKNLIWIWTNSEIAKTVEGSKQFYPGDNKVDMLASDVYDIDYKNTGKRHWGLRSYKEFYDVLQGISPNKPKALGECDALPNPTKIQNGTTEFDVPWVYALPWWSPVDGNGKRCYYKPCNPSDWVKTTYQHSLYLTLDELPNVYNR